MRVEIWGDLVCPWCYIGEARFERALAGFPHRDQIEVDHRSFELDPGRDRSRTESVEQMLVKKYGPRAREMEQQVAELARSEGLGYRTDRQVGNTFDAHRLLHLAKEHGVQHELITALFQANFAQARSLFDHDALQDLATQTGLDADAVRQVLADPTRYADAVRADEQTAADLGATGVPFFVIDGRYGISGGQSADTFARALRQAWDSRTPSTIEDGETCAPDDSCAVPAPTGPPSA